MDEKVRDGDLGKQISKIFFIVLIGLYGFVLTAK